MVRYAEFVAPHHESLVMNGIRFRRATMKTISRILIVAFIGCVIYFVTIGKNDFYRLIDALYEIVDAIGRNYLRK